MKNHEISFKEKPINPVKSLAPVFQSVDYATLPLISFTSGKVDGSNLVVLVPSCVYQGWQYAGQGESNPRLRIVFFFFLPNPTFLFKNRPLFSKRHAAFEI